VAPLATMLGTSVSLLLMFLARRFGQISSPVQAAHRSSLALFEKLESQKAFFVCKTLLFGIHFTEKAK
jgi:hypothetical protein